MMPAVVRSARLEGVSHGFLGRQGGVSGGLYASLNVGLGSGDDPAAVTENRRRALGAVAQGRRLVTLHQVHGAAVMHVTAAWADDARPRADAMVTATHGLALGVLTADCAPILLADSRAGVIGAAHAGWRGALGGIAEAAVAGMMALGADPDHIVGAIGPSIGRRSYEVDDDFRASFEGADPENERFFMAGVQAGRHQFDLEGFVVARLAGAGVTRVDALGLDTYAEPDRWFSFRRATHQGETDYGRQLSLIAL